MRRAADRTIEVARYRKFLSKLVPPMIERSEQLAQLQADTARDAAVERAREELDGEYARLVGLRSVNPAISEAEIEGVANERAALLTALPEARMRLDAVRFVVSGDFLSLK